MTHIQLLERLSKSKELAFYVKNSKKASCNIQYDNQYYLLNDWISFLPLNTKYKISKRKEESDYVNKTTISSLRKNSKSPIVSIWISELKISDWVDSNFEFWIKLLQLPKAKNFLVSLEVDLDTLSRSVEIANLAADCHNISFISIKFKSVDVENPDELIKAVKSKIIKNIGFSVSVTFTQVS